MLPGQPRIGRASYIHIKLRQEMHQLWVEIKHLLETKSDDDLAHLLTLTSRNKSWYVVVVAVAAALLQKVYECNKMEYTIEKGLLVIWISAYLLHNLLLHIQHVNIRN